MRTILLRARAKVYKGGWAAIALAVLFFGFAARVTAAGSSAKASSSVQPKAPVKAAKSQAAATKPAVSPAFKALREGDAKAKLLAVGEMTRLRTPEAVSSLAGAAQDKDFSVREAALTALAGIRDPRSSKALAEGLFDKDPAIRVICSRFIGANRLVEAEAELLQAVGRESDVSAKIEMLKALAALGSSGALSVLVAETARPKSVVSGQAATQALGDAVLATGALDALRKALLSDDAGIRAAGALSLAKINNFEGREEALKLLSGSDSGLRLKAAEVLVRIKDSEAQKRVTDAVSREKDPETKVLMEKLVKSQGGGR